MTAPARLTPGQRTAHILDRIQRMPVGRQNTVVPVADLIHLASEIELRGKIIETFRQENNRQVDEIERLAELTAAQRALLWAIRAGSDRDLDAIHARLRKAEGAA